VSTAPESPAVLSTGTVTAAVTPDWYPPWAAELAASYFSGTTCLFVLHGNVHDLVRAVTPDGQDSFIALTEFLATQVFGSWDVVLDYDVGQGVRPITGGNSKRLQEMVAYVSGIAGAPATWPREPEKVFPLFDRVVQQNLLLEENSQRKRVAFILEYAQYLAPASDLSQVARGDASRLVKLLGWAQNPYIKRVNMAFCLITEKLTDLNDRLANNPHVTTIEIPLPKAEERRRYINYVGAHNGNSNIAELTPLALTELSAGLNLVNFQVVLARGGKDKPLDPSAFRSLKKNLIERQCQGLVSFFEPEHKLDLVVGSPVAKERLQQDAAWIATGHLDMAPMGYLICGPVGTGKTFLAECYAGSIGIPCVKLLNFRSKYVGETEGNLEQVLKVLRSLGPVVVIIDEADAALGNREADGDSGTSGRVFSMIASQMGDTKYRGRIIWMLLTCRPDLLPIDLKRQGRAEVHIPLFYPSDPAELGQMFRTMARKNKCPLEGDVLPELPADLRLSGADVESILLAAKRNMLTSEKTVIGMADLHAAIDTFIPSIQGLEKEYQEIAAVLECTDRGFLPPNWREQVAVPGGRVKLQERLAALRTFITN